MEQRIGLDLPLPPEPPQTESMGDEKPRGGTVIVIDADGNETNL